MQRPGPYAVYLAKGAASAFLNNMVFVALTIYYVQVVGMNPFLLVLAGTAQEVAIALFEVPTGVVADTYGRRRSVLIGYTLGALCFLAQGLLPLVAVVLLAEFARGLAYTFVSGAEEAWLADEIGEERLAAAFLRHGQLGALGGLAGMVAGVGLGAIGLALPVIAGGLLGLGLAFFLALAMRETNFRPAARDERTARQALGATLREGLRVARGRPVTIMLIASGLLFGAFSEGFDRLWEAHFLLTIGFPAWGALAPIVWIGALQIGGKLVGLAVREIALRRLQLRERLDAGGQGALARGLIVSYAALIAGVIGLALAGQFVPAAVAYWLAVAARGVAGPLYAAWLNQGLPSNVRATVLSLSGQANAIGQSVGGPALGALGTLVSLRAALLVAALLLSPITLLYARTLRRGRAAPLVPDAPAA